MKQYLINGPGGGKWSIFDHGNEMTINAGPTITSPVVATVPPEFARTMTDGHKWEHVVSAASSIHVAALDGDENLILHKLWRSGAK